MRSVGKLIQQLTDGSAEQRLAARMILMALDEEAIEPLIAHYYAGVTEATGITLLELMAEIGGPDALATLWNVYHFEVCETWIQAAVRGLLHNRDNLDKDEIQELQSFIQNQS